MGIAKAMEEITVFEAGPPTVMNHKAMKSVENPYCIPACFSPPSVDDDKEIMPIDGGAAAKLVRKTVKENGEVLETTILKDEIIKLKGDTSSNVYPDNLMLVTVIAVSDKEKNIKRRRMSFLTNNMTLSSVTIANLYRARWQIEAFFKLTKQNLRLNEFLCAGRDAVKTQIYIALTALLLLRYWRATFKEHWSSRRMLAAIRSLLREHRGLRACMDRATPDCGDRKKADNRGGPDGRPPCKPPNLFAGKQGRASRHGPSRGRPGILDSRPPPFPDGARRGTIPMVTEKRRPAKGFAIASPVGSRPGGSRRPPDLGRPAIFPARGGWELRLAFLTDPGAFFR
ncbi:MAG: transposase [Deltaproteobacteria bacterium]|nr:transposase [Deltaproteobacteria bacterium]